MAIVSKALGYAVVSPPGGVSKVLGYAVVSPPSPPTITFDGVEGTDAVEVSATEFDVAIPAHAAGVVDVAISMADGRQATLADGFTYGLVILSVTPNHGPTSGGTRVRLVLNYDPTA